MAKTAKLKKKQPTPHSRAARRASPSAPAPTRKHSASPDPTTAKPHILSAQTGSGISKRKSKTSKLTRAQRVRAEKAMERAADDMDKWEKKKMKSLERARGVKSRARGWEEVNGESEEVVRKGGVWEVEGSGEVAEGKASAGWVDVGMEEDVDDGSEGKGEGEKESVAQAVDEDELL